MLSFESCICNACPLKHGWSSHASSGATLSLVQLAEMADRIVEVANHPEVASIATTGLSVDEMRQITDTLSRLVAVLESLLHRSQDQSPAAYQPSSPHTCHLVPRHFPPSQSPQVLPTLHPSGKLAGWPLVTTSVIGRPQSHLFYICDCTSGVSVLVGTGAEVSLHAPSLQFNYIASIDPPDTKVYTDI